MGGNGWKWRYKWVAASAHEKLAADESFRIFVTLTNDVLGQLETKRSGVF